MDARLQAAPRWQPPRGWRTRRTRPRGGFRSGMALARGKNRARVRDGFTRAIGTARDGAGIMPEAPVCVVYHTCASRACQAFPKTTIFPEMGHKTRGAARVVIARVCFKSQRPRAPDPVAHAIQAPSRPQARVHVFRARLRAIGAFPPASRRARAIPPAVPTGGHFAIAAWAFRPTFCCSVVQSIVVPQRVSRLARLWH
jgi:hypothetical protein